MDAGQTRIAEETLREQPDPPRDVAFPPLLVASTHSYTGKVLLGGGVVWAIVAGLSTLPEPPANEPSWTYPAATVLFGALAVLFLVTPIIHAWRWWRAIRTGVLGEARVLEVRSGEVGAQPSREPIDSGLARGEWAVQVGARHFYGDFETDADWVDRLHPDLHLRVLAHPTEAKVFFSLGPVESGGEDD